VALAGTLAVAAAVVGTGSAARLRLEGPVGPEGAPARPSAWPKISTFLAYGALGCLFEAPAAGLGRFGKRLQDAAGAGTLQRTLGLACNGLGYGAALLAGALLTVLRCGVAGAYVFLTGAGLLTLSTAGALGGLGLYLKDLVMGTADAPAPSPQAP
jgi:hypothetical protein